MGQHLTPKLQNTAGQLPTQNWSRGTFEYAEDISGDVIETTMMTEENRVLCMSCKM